MDTSHAISGTSRRFAKPLIAVVLALSLALSGCSGGGEGGSGSSGGSGETPRTSADTGETTAAPEETTTEATSAGAAPVEETTGQGGSESSGGSTALSGGLEEARSEAESWNGDAELYAIASLQPTVNAEGENEGWLYSFVSESAGSIISIPYSGGEVRNAQGQELPAEQIDRISSIALSEGELVDTPEAIQRSAEVQSYLEENPQAGASAGVDAASRDEPEWILSIPAEGLQDRVSAVE